MYGSILSSPLALGGRQKIAEGSDRFICREKCRVAIGQETGWDSAGW